MLLKTFGVVLVGLAIATADAGDEAAKKDLQMLQGDWVMQSSERDGMKAPAELVRTFARTVKNKSYTVNWEDEAGAHSSSGVLTLDPMRSPKHLDALLSDGPSKGKTMLGIYKLEGDAQTLCAAFPGKARPTAFDSKQGTLIVWKRAKK
jgi:uncharacterized protein (TIGR03067 family)